MKNVIIFGPTDFGRMMKYYIESDTQKEVVAFCVEEKYLKESQFCGKEVIAFESVEKEYSPELYEILIAIGNSKMNDVRKRIFEMCKEKGYDVASFIHSSSKVHTNDIGEGNIILENCLIYPFTRIGKGNLFWDNVVVSHDCAVGDFNYFSGHSDLCGYVQVGNNTFLGKKCVLNNYLKVADYTLVGAAAYVKKDTKPYEVVVPVRSIVLEDKLSTDLM